MKPLIKSTALLFVVLSSSSLVLTGCGKKEGPANAEKKEAATSVSSEPIRPVKTIVVGSSTLGSASFLPGEVRPRFEYRYAFRVSGKMAQRKVEVGDVVKAGQVLAVMDSTDITPSIAAQAAQVEAAKTDVTLQQAEFNRINQLAGKGFLSTAALDRQKAALDAAQARQRAAQAQLESVRNGANFQTLRADQGGVVIGVNAEAGSVVAAGQSIVRVAQASQKELLVNVPERSVQSLKAGARLQVSIDALPGRQFNAQLRELSPNADPASRSYAARLSLPEAGEEVRWGMSGTVQMVTSLAQAIVVPNSAIYTRDAQARVWVYDPSTQTVRAVAVSLGQSTADGVAITKGLNNGQVVVTAGANLLREGQKVRVLDAPATKTGA
jgi:membrane fusion protein, multidrug efflux system